MRGVFYRRIAVAGMETGSGKSRAMQYEAWTAKVRQWLKRVGENGYGDLIDRPDISEKNNLILGISRANGWAILLFAVHLRYSRESFTLRELNTICQRLVAIVAQPLTNTHSVGLRNRADAALFALHVLRHGRAFLNEKQQKTVDTILGLSISNTGRWSTLETEAEKASTAHQPVGFRGILLAAITNRPLKATPSAAAGFAPFNQLAGSCSLLANSVNSINSRGSDTSRGSDSEPNEPGDATVPSKAERLGKMLGVVVERVGIGTIYAPTRNGQLALKDVYATMPTS